MAKGTNQHYVPQFYFRYFSTDERSIGVLLKHSGRLVGNAAIKTQCARINFYGSAELEAHFSKLESLHAVAIQRVLDMANCSASPDLTPEELMHFLEAILFQRGRTELQIEKFAPAQESLRAEVYKHFLECSDGIEHKAHLTDLVSSKKIDFGESPQAIVGKLIVDCLDSVLGVTDLRLCLLRNRTDFPFIFSDSPVVFYNSYCRNVLNRGVLGLQCPGLQIYFPLSSTTAAFLFDRDKYGCTFGDSLQFDVFSRADISQLNALQMHHSSKTVYFGCVGSQQYIKDLWQSHRPRLEALIDRCVVGADLLVDGRPPDGQLIQTYEPQLRHNLKLSFIGCDPISEMAYTYSPRTPEIRDELMRRAEVRCN